MKMFGGNMRVEVLVVTMNQRDHSLLDRMNIQSDAIVCNQCNRDEIEKFQYKGHNIRWFSFDERGVGLNRNNCLMRSNADICICADDDMVFVDNYENIVLKWFEKQPSADVLIFNLIEDKPTHRRNNIKVTGINQFNYGKYGAARFVFKRESIFMNGIFFNLMFGGGATYSSGEDSIFLRDCLKKGLKVIAVPSSIAKLDDLRNSTWFCGYNDKFFFDKGVLYGLIYKRIAWFVAFYNCFRHRKGRYKEYGWKKAFAIMRHGIKRSIK